jgi:hypothetical protein
MGVERDGRGGPVIPPLYDDSDFHLRLRRLLALEISRVVEDLEARRSLLLEVWGRHRDRGPFIDTLHTRWKTLSMPDLATLDTPMMVNVEAFYRELDELTLYFRFTQDMPTTLSDVLDDGIRRLAAYGALAIEALGGVPPRPLIEFDDIEPESDADDAFDGFEHDGAVVDADLMQDVRSEE